MSGVRGQKLGGDIRGRTQHTPKVHSRKVLTTMAPGYVVGVDGGTEGIRAGVFDVEGNALAFASSAYSTNFPQPGWAEQVSSNPRLVDVEIMS